MWVYALALCATTRLVQLAYVYANQLPPGRSQALITGSAVRSLMRPLASSVGKRRGILSGLPPRWTTLLSRSLLGVMAVATGAASGIPRPGHNASQGVGSLECLPYTQP